MLRNPDISPSASMNRWILAILMFHFTLVHVPGTHHTPDGLSRRKPQPGDKEEPEDDFEDWINNINRFIHFLNPHPSISNYTTLTPPITLYVNSDPDTIDITKVNQPEDKTTIPYSIIPRSDSAIEADRRLEKVQAWLEALDCPPDLTDSEYKIFMRYCMEFIIIGNRLWRKNPQGQHKMVVPSDQRLFLIASAHNDIGHHGVYATNALLSECYWWPNMSTDIKWYIQTCHVCQTRNT
jgi:Integrase zinc binding domain